jgi:M6 family metalloprotease-like protein
MYLEGVVVKAGPALRPSPSPECLRAARGARLWACLGAAACLAWFAASAQAVPANPAPATVIQPDGTPITIYLRGDEHVRWVETAEGRLITRSAKSGAWVYATVENGAISETPYVVGQVSPETVNLAWPDAEAINAAADEPRAAQNAIVTNLPTTGTVANLVVLVNFSDLDLVYTQADFARLFNVDGYSDHGAVGSVVDYFAEVSRGDLIVASAVTAPVAVPHEFAYYGANDPLFGGDLRPDQFVSDALLALDDTGFDFAPYDINGDGWVDGLTVIHAGGGEEYAGNDADYLYSTFSQLPSPVTYDGKQLQPFQLVAARRGQDSDPPSQGIMRIGPICHLLGRALGLPILYDTDVGLNASKGIGDFGLMGLGLWNGDENDGTSPAHPMAWSQIQLGWVTPTQITNGDPRTIDALQTSGQIYKMGPTSTPSEYFLIANRQGYGFDAALPGTDTGRGILIWHIDENQPDNDDQSHYRVDLEESSASGGDGRQHLALNENEGEDTDYYRGGSAWRFAHDTTPGTDTWSGLPNPWDIVDIGPTGGTMSFDVNPPADAPGIPQDVEAEVGGVCGEVIVRWSRVDGADQDEYRVYYQEVSEPVPPPPFNPQQDGDPPSGSIVNVEVGPTKEVRITGLDEGVEYYFAVTASDLTESDYSTIVTAPARTCGCASVPFTEDFEGDPTLQPVWRISGTNDYRTQVTDLYQPHGGSYHVTMDDSVDGDGSPDDLSTNELTLCVNLFQAHDVALSFWIKSFADSVQGPPPTPFFGTADFDGVAVSDDGIAWYEARGLRDVRTDATWEKITVDLDATVLPNGLTYDSPFYVRFNHTDDKPIDTDGFAIDDIDLTSGGTASLPFEEDFESGALADYWRVTGTGGARTVTTTDHGPFEGDYHLIMDDTSPADESSRNELTLAIDLQGESDVIVTFWAKEFSDEPDGPPPTPFYGSGTYGGADFDGVAVSEDGYTWYEVQGLRDIGADGEWVKFEIDLDPLIQSLGLNYSRNFRIRFNHYDNISVDSTPTTDGIAIDLIKIVAGTSAVLPVVEDFETAPLATHWRVRGTNTFRTQIVESNPAAPHGVSHSGDYFLTLDDRVDDTSPSRNEFTLIADLLGKNGVLLSFWAREYNDEPDGPPSSPFFGTAGNGGADFDGVAISVDGFEWYEIQGLRNLSNDWQFFLIDLDAAAQQVGLQYTDRFRIQFTQYDDHSVDSDGIALDDIELTTADVATVPFTEDFEAAELETYWRLTGTNDWRTRVTTENGPHAGAQHLTMDDSEVNENPARNETTLTVDLLGQHNVILSFYAKSFNDEDDGPPDIPFVEGADFDGVAVSMDGATWYEIQSLRGLPKDTWTYFEVDLDDAIAPYGLAYTSLFRIRFNHFDNKSINLSEPIQSDGIAIDDVEIAPGGVAQMPFSEGFESGALADYWRATGTNEPRTMVTDSYGPPAEGIYHVTMDTLSGADSRNELTLTIDLSFSENVQLSFQARSYSDEFTPPPTSPFITGENFDGLAISEDGYHWFPVTIAGWPTGDSGWVPVIVNLDAARDAWGLQYTNAFRIRFNHYDNSSLDDATDPDGLAIDDILIAGDSTCPLPGEAVNPTPANAALGVDPTTDLLWSESASPNPQIATAEEGCEPFGDPVDAFASQYRFRGNVYTVDDPRTLSAIRMGLAFTGTVDVYFYVLESDALDGPYTVLHEQMQSLLSLGTGPLLYSSGAMDLELLPHKFYAIGAAWGSTPADFRYYRAPVSGSLPTSWAFGTIHQNAQASLTLDEPPITEELYFGNFTDSEYYMELCFGGAGGETCPTVYDVYFDMTDPPATLLCDAIDVTQCDPTPGTPDALPDGTYHWQVVARNCCGQTLGPIWSFTVGATGFVPADFDKDGDVDLSDYGHLLGCFNGPSRPYANPDCDDADLDNDGDVDLSDYGIFLDCFNGPNRPPNCAPEPPCNTPPYDVDGDGDVDLSDYGHLLDCFAGVGAPYPQPDCQCLDNDGDGDVDLSDYGKFLDCYSGPNVPPNC